MILKLNMAIFIVLLTLLQVSGALYGPRLLTGEVGGSVTIKCFYPATRTNRYDRKYWCKVSGVRRVCNTIISTNHFISEDYKGRASLTDFPENGMFTVQVTQLKWSDTGVYRCGIGANNRALFISMNLKVSEDSDVHQSSKLVLGELRGSVTIQCQPKNAKGGGRKFWCKLGKNGCPVIADSDGYVHRNYEGRIFFTSEESSGIFKILINTLKKEDSGLYKCGIGMLNDSESTRTIDLQVTDESTVPRVLRFLSGPVGGVVSAKCHYDPRRTYEMKYWCRWKEAGCPIVADTNGFVQDAFKGRIQIISDKKKNGTFTVVMRHLEETDAGWYLCGMKDGHIEQTFSVKLHIQDRPTPSASVSSLSPMSALHGVTSHVSSLSPTSALHGVTSHVSSLSPTSALHGVTSHVSSLSPTSALHGVTSHVSSLSPTSALHSVTSHVSSLSPTSALHSVTSHVSSLSPTSALHSVTSHVNVIHQTFFMSTVTEEILEKTTSEDRFVTFSNPVYDSSSSKLQLLPFVIPALIVLLLLSAVAIFIFIRVKLHKKKVKDRSSVSNLEARVNLTDLKCLEEQTMEVNMDPAKQLKSEPDHDKEYSSRPKKDPGASDENVQVFLRREPMENVAFSTVYHIP